VFEPAEDFTWVLDAVLRPDDCAEEDFFGRAVEVEGDRIAVAAFRPYFSSFRSNSVHVFERTEEGSWEPTARIVAPEGALEDAFASSIDLSGDRLLVTSAGDAGSDGHEGAAYVFEIDDNGRWTLAARLEGEPGNGEFGASCALDGDLAAVSATTSSRRTPGTVYLFARQDDGSWKRTSTFGGIRDFFIPMSADEGRLLVGQRDAGRIRSGAATLFERGEDARWRGTVRLRSPSPYPSGGFGSGVALSGRHALVVGFDEQLRFDYNIDRVVYVFEKDEAGAWSRRQIIDVGENHFGSSLAADSGLAVIGAAADGSRSAAYVVRLQ